MARQKTEAPAETVPQNAAGIIGAEGNQPGSLVLARKVGVKRTARLALPFPRVIARLVLAIHGAAGTFKISGFRTLDERPKTPKVSRLKNIMSLW